VHSSINDSPIRSFCGKNEKYVRSLDYVRDLGSQVCFYDIKSNDKIKNIESLEKELALVIGPNHKEFY
jgi:hypothetical protein